MGEGRGKAGGAGGDLRRGTKPARRRSRYDLRIRGAGWALSIEGGLPRCAVGVRGLRQGQASQRPCGCSWGTALGLWGARGERGALWLAVLRLEEGGGGRAEGVDQQRAVQIAVAA